MTHNINKCPLAAAQLSISFSFSPSLAIESRARFKRLRSGLSSLAQLIVEIFMQFALCYVSIVCPTMGMYSAFFYLLSMHFVIRENGKQYW